MILHVVFDESGPAQAIAFDSPDALDAALADLRLARVRLKEGATRPNGLVLVDAFVQSLAGVMNCVFRGCTLQAHAEQLLASGRDAAVADPQ